jgi:hypothetical protein
MRPLVKELLGMFRFRLLFVLGAHGNFVRWVAMGFITLRNVLYGTG